MVEYFAKPVSLGLAALSLGPPCARVLEAVRLAIAGLSLNCVKLTSPR